MGIKKQYKKFQKAKLLLIGHIDKKKWYLGDIILLSVSFNIIDKTPFNLVDFTGYNESDVENYIHYLIETINEMQRNRQEKYGDKIKFEPIDQLIERVRNFLVKEKEVFQQYAKIYWEYYGYVENKYAKD